MADMTRKARWRFELLDRFDQTVAKLDGVTSHSIELAGTERLRGTLRLDLDQRAEEIDWLTQRVRVLYSPDDWATTQPWGVWVLSSPTEQRRGTRQSWQVDCYSKLILVDEHTQAAAVSLPAGTKVAPYVKTLLDGLPGARVAVTDTGATTKNVRTWPPGESTLTVINDLLTDSGYWSLWVDREGVYQVAPWIAPKDRPLAWSFHAGPASLHRPDWSRTQNLRGIPNRVVVASNGTDSEAAISGVAENNDPDSPFSIPNRGVVSRSYDAEVTSVSAARSLAQRRLEDAMHPVLKADVQHALVPIWHDDLVSFWPSGEEEAQLYSVQRMSVGSGYNAHVSAVWRGVSGHESGESDGDDSEL